MKEELKKQPVVVILGHVDHGKTSLLRAIKNLPFSSKKPGGVITQEIGAFEVEIREKKITFIDTPGHEAFSQMRARGAKVADLAVLVVSAVEGPKEQTKEALEVIKEAKIPFLVAITKVDLPGANPKKVQRELSKIGIITEELGGEVPCIESSAKTGQGIKDILELILLLAEMKNLKADLKKKASGVIVESHLDPKKGILATVILEEGILRVGDFIGTESAFGKVRLIQNSEGKKVKEIFPGQAGLITGFEEIPGVGEKIEVFESLEKAKENIKVKLKERERKEPKEGQKILKLILKADCLGSLEAIEEMIDKIPQEKILIDIVRSGVGEISEEDLKLAKASKSFIFAFKTKPDKIAKKILEREKIKIFSFSVIYELIEGVRKLAEKVLEPEIIRKKIGEVQVLVEFWREGERQIVGGRVLEGEVKKPSEIEIWRKDELIGKGRLLNLQKNKKDIEKAQKGEEIGILYEGKGKIKEGDILKFFFEEKRKIEI